MASLGPTPPKRLKISPPLNPDLQPQKRAASPSKLPVRNGSNVRPITTKGSLYGSPSKGKNNLGPPRRSPYSERPAPPKTNGSSVGDGVTIGKLNFGSTTGLREGGGGGGGGGRFRRTGGPRLSQSPARRSSFFNESNHGSSLSRMGRLGEESESPSQSAEDGKSSPTEKMHKNRKMDAQTKGKGKEAMEKPGKRRRQENTEEVVEENGTKQVNAENEALRKLIEARVNALRMEVEDLKEEIQKEETRVEKDTKEVPSPEGDLEAIIKRLLTTNDSSHTTLPKLKYAPKDPEIPSARPLAVADPLPQLSAFHCLTFTSTSTTTITSTPEPPTYLDDETIQLPFLPPPDSPDQLNLTQRHIAHGYSSNRLLFFKLSFDVSAPSWTVSRISSEVSPWARRELRAPLNKAAQEGDINTTLCALSSYTVLAKKRAAVFSRLCRTFPHLLPVFTPVARAKESAKDVEDRKVGRSDIIPWLGTSLLRFHSRTAKDVMGETHYTSSSESGVELIVSWGIEIGVGGEAESVVEADVRLPVYWAEVDEMKAFSKVGEIFRLLVKERGVFEATKCVVGLIFQ